MIPISLLIFDLDGTLVDTLEDIAESVNHALGGLGKAPIAKDTVREFVGDGSDVLLARSLSGDTRRLDEAKALYKEHYRKNMLVHARLYPSVRETLEYFKTVPMAVISNKTREFIDPILDSLGISRYFKITVGAGNGLRLKPAPDSLLRIIGELHGIKEQTAIVGDGTTDILAGRAAGIVTCAVTCGFRGEDELLKLSPDYILSRLSELKRIFIPDAHKS